MIDVSEVTAQYVETLLWQASCRGTAPAHVCDHNDRGDDCDTSLLSLNYECDDIAPDAMAEIAHDVRDFCAANAADLAGLSASDIGHNFVLSRNRHGAGFWDRGLGERGELLHKAATVYGEQDAYVGDNGKVYVQ